MDDLEKYTDFVFGEQTGYVYAPVKKSAEDFIPRFYSWPSEKEALHDWIRTNGNDPAVEAVYISPAVYKEKRAVKSAIKSVQVSWVEFDGQEKIEFTKLGVKPSMIVQTSQSTHVHCYWKVEGQRPEVLEDINHRLTYFLDADYGGWDVTQLLRPPDSWNRKKEYETPFPVKLAYFQPESVSTDVFDKAPEVETRTPTIEVTELLTLKKVLQEAALPIGLIRRITKETVPTGARSSFLSKIAYELVEERLSQLQIVSVLAHVDERVGKFTGRSDRMLRLTAIADMALHKLSVENATVLYTLKDILHHTDDLEWIFPGWLHTTGMMILTSAPGVGKTQMTFQMAVSLIKKIPFLGKAAFGEKEHKCLYLSLEMDVRSLKYIVMHQSNEWGELDHSKLLVLDEIIPFTEIENIIEQHQPTVLFLDSLSEILGDNSDANAEAKAAMRWLRKLRRRYGLAVITIHHNRKASESNKKPKSLSDLYGSFIFAKDVDTVINLWEVGKDIEIEALKARFGQKGVYANVVRNENLWFEVTKDASKESTGPTDNQGVSFKF